MSQRYVRTLTAETETESAHTRETGSISAMYTRAKERDLEGSLHSDTYSTAHSQESFLQYRETIYDNIQVCTRDFKQFCFILLLEIVSAMYCARVCTLLVRM